MDGGLLVSAIFAGITNGFVYGLIGLGISAIFRGTGIINVMQGEFAALAAIATAVLLANGVSLVMAISITLVGVAVIGLLIERVLVRPMVRRRANEVSYLLLTLGLALLSSAALLYFFGREARFLSGIGGTQTLPVLGASVRIHSLAVIGLAVLITLVLRRFYKSTTFGLAMVAAASDADGAATTGVDVPRTRGATFALGAALGAVAGILIAPLTPLHYLSGMGLTLKGFAAAVLGGLTHPFGAIAGGLSFGLVESLAALVLPSGYRDVVAFAVLIVVLIALPRGLLATVSVRRGG